MDSTEMGCILAGTVAIGLLSAHAHKKSTHRHPGTRPMSACNAMRSTMRQPAASAKATALTTPPAAQLPESVQSQYDSVDADANAAQLGEMAQRVKAATNSRRMAPVPQMIEKGTKQTSQTGGYRARLGDTQWEQNPSDLPKQTRCDNVMLPMNNLQEHAHETQHGEFNFYDTYDASTDPTEGLFVSELDRMK